jgi:hypothetical protein
MIDEDEDDQPTPNLGGRPPHEPTPERRGMVEAMSGFGVRQEHIGQALGISRPTLRLHYREELDSGLRKANLQVAQSLHKKALADGPNSVAACIFWLRVRGGWKPPVAEVKHSGSIGSYDLSKLDDAQLERLESILAAAAVSDGDQGGEAEEEE